MTRDTINSQDGDGPPVYSSPVEGVGVIELNRPRAANRIEQVDLQVLTDILTRCEAESGVRVLILQSRGEHFSSGFDLGALSAQAARGSAGMEHVSADFERLANRFENTPLITIAAVHGPVIGGSTDLVLACDLRVATDRASMHMPAAKFGLPLYASALQRYVSRLGVNAAKRLVLTAETMQAAALESMGFYTSLAEQSQLHHECLRMARQIASMPPQPLFAMKRVLNAATIGQGNCASSRDWLAQAFDSESIIERISLARLSHRARQGADA